MTKTELWFAIIALISTVAPIICQTIAIFINSRNSLKIEKLKLFDKERINALNSFIEKSNSYLADFDKPNASALRQDMVKSILTLQIYFDFNNDTRDKLFRLERIGGYDEDWEFRNSLICQLSKKLSKHIN